MITRESKIKVTIFDEVFYACPVGTEIPSWLEGAPITKNEDGTFSYGYIAPYKKAVPGTSIWVLEGTMMNGDPKISVVDVNDIPNQFGECAIDDLTVISEDGKELCTLREFAQGFENELDYNLRLTPEEYVKKLENEA